MSHPGICVLSPADGNLLFPENNMPVVAGSEGREKPSLPGRPARGRVCMMSTGPPRFVTVCCAGAGPSPGPIVRTEATHPPLQRRW